MIILKCPKCFYGLDFATLIQQFNKLSPESSLLEKMQEYLHIDDSVEPENSAEFPNMKVEPLEVDDTQTGLPEPIEPDRFQTEPMEVKEELNSESIVKDVFVENLPLFPSTENVQDLRIDPDQAKKDDIEPFKTGLMKVENEPDPGSFAQDVFAANLPRFLSPQNPKNKRKASKSMDLSAENEGVSIDASESEKVKR